MDELVSKRTQNSKTYDLGSGQRKTIIGQGIAHYFDGTTWQDVDFSTADVATSPWTHQYSKHRWLIYINANTSRIRIHPEKTDLTKYMEIAVASDIVVNVQVVNSKFIRVYKNTTNVNYNFIITPYGIKTLYRINNSSAPTSFVFRVALNNLTLSGRKIMDGATTVLKLPNPAMLDGNYNEIKANPVTENIQAGQITLSYSHTGLSYPCYLDPTVNIGAASNEWGEIYSGDDNSRWGQGTTTYYNWQSGYVEAMVFLIDLSSIPSTAIINSATYYEYGQAQQGTPAPNQFWKIMWTDLANGDIVSRDRRNSTSNWTSSMCAWPNSPTWDYNPDITATMEANYAAGWNHCHITSIVADAVANCSGILRMKGNVIGGAGRYNYGYSFSHETYPAYIEIDHTDPVSLTAQTPDAGIVGSAYSYNMLYSGGTAPLVWDISSGTPPTGLTIDENTGELVIASITSGLIGTYTFTVHVIDAADFEDSLEVTLIIYGKLEITTTHIMTVSAGHAFSKQINATGGDDESYVWSKDSGTFPPSLTISEAGVLSGTGSTDPDDLGSYTFTLKVTDGIQSDTQSYTVGISALHGSQNNDLIIGIK